MNAIPSSRLRELLTLQSPGRVADALGGSVTTWTTVDTVPAELVPVRAWERMQGGTIQAQTDYRFRIRVRSDVTASWRVGWTPIWPSDATARTLEIHGVLPDGDGRQWLLLDCGEVRA